MLAIYIMIKHIGSYQDRIIHDNKKGSKPSYEDLEPSDTVSTYYLE